MGEDRNDPEGLDGVAKNAVDLWAGFGLPRLSRFEQLVRLADDRPRSIESFGGCNLVPCFDGALDSGFGNGR